MKSQSTRSEFSKWFAGKIITFCLLVGFSGLATAQSPELADGYPDRYTVVEGDNRDTIEVTAVVVNSCRRVHDEPS